MRGDESTNGRLDVPELWKTLQELEEGTLGEPRSDELGALLCKSPAARRAYLEYFQQSAVLRMEAAKLHERGLLPFVGSATQTRRVFQRSVMAAAALVAIAAVIAALIAVARPEAARFSATAAADTRWSVDGVAHGSGEDSAQVKQGSTLHVSSGTLRLETDEGDLLVLQGPATVSFPDLHNPHLKEGWLWIDTARSGEPFEVDAGGLLIRDIGTRFGVRAPKDGPIEVHLVTGRVEVISAKSGKRLLDQRQGRKAFAFAPNELVEELDMAPDPFPALPHLFGQPANYRTTVFGQAPIGYWTLDKSNEGSLANLILGSPPASHGVAVREGESGLEPEKGFRGLPAGNRSLYMEGDPMRSAVVGLDGLNGVRQREGAISFWIRREPGTIATDEILWLAGLGPKSDPTPLEAMLHTRLDSSGHVLFGMKNGDTTVNLTSPGSIDDGKWHHVVASWAPRSVDLYVDGILVGHDDQPRIIAEGNLRGRSVRFGKPSADLRETSIPFTGWVDEISLWDRPLSAVEVGCQYESALGDSEK